MKRLKLMKQSTHQQSLGASLVALTLHTPVPARLPEKILRLMAAAYAAHGGTECMSLDAVRELEQTLKRRFENEHEQRQH